MTSPLDPDFICRYKCCVRRLEAERAPGESGLCQHVRQQRQRCDISAVNISRLLYQVESVELPRFVLKGDGRERQRGRCGIEARSSCERLASIGFGEALPGQAS